MHIQAYIKFRFVTGACKLYENCIRYRVHFGGGIYPEKHREVQKNGHKKRKKAFSDKINKYRNCWGFSSSVYKCLCASFSLVHFVKYCTTLKGISPFNKAFKYISWLNFISPPYRGLIVILTDSFFAVHTYMYRQE